MRILPFMKPKKGVTIAGVDYDDSGGGGGGGGGGGTPTISDAERLVYHYDKGGGVIADVYEATIKISLNFYMDEREFSLSDLGISNVSVIHNYYAVARNSTNTNAYNAEYYENSNNQLRCWFPSNTAVRISQCLSSVTNGYMYITMRYEKSTT